MNKFKEITLSSQDVYRGNLMLVNKNHTIKVDERELGRDLAPVLATHQDVLLKKHCAFKLRQLLYACDGASKIVPVSGYRSKSEQEQIFSTSQVENGSHFTAKYVAYPNRSEHQTGLAIDVAENQGVIDFIRPSFPYGGICNIFRELAPDYGFIERYQRGKEHITGIAQEPWHFRYVGYPHAAVIKNQNLSLEEYIDFIKEFPFGGEHLLIEKEHETIEIFNYPCQQSSMTIPVPMNRPYQISGNNVDGFIVTIWRS